MRNTSTRQSRLKIHLDSIGCRLNQSEIEALGGQFRSRGHDLVPQAEGADLAVINTCAVTVDAASASRQLIRRAARAGAEVIAAGCWATFDPQGAAALPGVSRVVGNADKDFLVPQVLGIPTETFDLEPVARAALPGARLRTRAFIKVQDGCDNRCTFCVTTVLRGAARSRPLPAVLADIQSALAGGVKEIVLSGVHLGSWGQDFAPAMHLKDLVHAILRETDAPRLRLSSLEPWDLDGGFFQAWADEPRLCRQLHLPLQSGCDLTLRRMARKTTQASFRALVDAARQASPCLALTTDLIAGFPGETADEFAATLAFVEEMAFADAHIFPYSARHGTAAASMPRQVPHPVRRARAARLRAAVDASASRYRHGFIGGRLEVLWENVGELTPTGWTLGGMADNALRVQASAPQNLWNEIASVEIVEAAGETLKGIIRQM